MMYAFYEKLVSEQITDENYNYILNNYIIEKVK